LIEVVLVPVGMPFVLSVGMAHEQASLSDDLSAPALLDWLVLFGRPEILFIGLLAGALILYDVLFVSRPEPDRAEDWLPVLVALCIGALLVAGGGYAAHVTERVFDQQMQEASPPQQNPPPPRRSEPALSSSATSASANSFHWFPVSSTALLILLTTTIRFELRRMRYKDEETGA
jgi:hypothetical protein